MPKLIVAVVLILGFASAAPAAAADLVFDWAAVGNAGNANDTHGEGYGAVANAYRISKHEVTNNQYAEFLNAVAATDSFGGSDPNLYNANMDITRSGSSGSFTYAVNAGFETNPVNYVSFFDSMRFVNWLENGQGTGGTEGGVYNIGTGVNEPRAAGATFFLPSENEWYKAAYHDPTASGEYWDYPTQSNTAPTAASANVDNVVGDTTDVGTYTSATSFYGTFDQAGNLWEWNEAVKGSDRGMRGGSWNLSWLDSAASNRDFINPTVEFNFIGFRVASVPEPSSRLYGGVVFLGLLCWKKIRS
ncbi:MAG: SUMF1/EgtB/PvdO family nonheme iron enzyme [Pirellulaceae bacterium]